MLGVFYSLFQLLDNVPVQVRIPAAPEEDPGWQPPVLVAGDEGQLEREHAAEVVHDRVGRGEEVHHPDVDRLALAGRAAAQQEAPGGAEYFSNNKSNVFHIYVGK